MFQEIENTLETIKKRATEVYDQHNLIFNDSAFRTVKGDIHAKVLGKYISSIFGLEIKYEAKIAGTRCRADVLIEDSITLEVKALGSFSAKYLKERYEKITKAQPSMKHIYVTFRERKDWVHKTKAILEPLGIEVFVLSDYRSGELFPDELKGLWDTINKVLRDRRVRNMISDVL